MNKNILVILCTFGLTLTLHAQSDKKAEEILKGVSAKYKSFSSIKADFSYTMENPKEKQKESQNGSVQLKGNKYKLEIKGQEVICDGSNVWTYLRESNEVQINELNKKDDAITPSNIFIMYEKGFDFLFVDEITENGKLNQIIDITPQDKKKNYFKIRLTVDKNEKLIASTVVFDKNGSRQSYTIKKFTPNTVMSDALFSFDKSKYPGVEEVDLR